MIVDPCFIKAPYTNQMQLSSGTIVVRTSSSLHSFVLIRMMMYIVGPMAMREIRMRIHTVESNGARRPDPVADSEGRFIITTQLDSSKLVDQFTRLSISWNTGKKAAAMSTSCTER